MNIAVLLACHNRKEKTLNCLHQITTQTEMTNHLISVFLVDDNSTDGTKDAVKSKYSFVHIIDGNGELFWNRGMLLAWETALKTDNYDAVIWLNDDTILKSDAISTLCKYSNKYPNSIIVGSTAWTTDHSKLSYGGYYNYNELLIPTDRELPCRFFNGNIVLIPNSVSEKIGLLDPYFRHSMGDFDYGVRATKNGVSIYVLPVLGYCDRNGSYVKYTDTKFSLKERLKFLYSPLGNNPIEAFYYYKKISIKKAFEIFIYLHLKTIFPSCFQNNNKSKLSEK